MTDPEEARSVAVADDSNVSRRRGRLLLVAAAVAACRLHAGDIALGAGRPPEGGLVLPRSLSESLVSVHNKGQAYMELKRFRSAALEFQRIAEAAPRASFPRVHQGMALFGARGYLSAVESLQKALALDPRGVQARYFLARSFRQLGRLEDSARQFKEAIALDEREEVFHYRLAAVYSEMGEPREAEDEYRRAIELAPTHPEAYYRLGKLLVGADRKREGETILKEYYRLYRDQARIGKNLYGRREPASQYDELSSPDFGPPKPPARAGGRLEIRLSGVTTSDSVVLVKAGRFSIKKKLGPAAAAFDLGGHDRADVVKVSWPDGTFDIRFDVPAGKVLVIRKVKRKGVGHRF